MDWKAFALFFGIALWETLQPGPTLALVIDTSLNRGKESAYSVIVGVTAANIAFVLFTLSAIFFDAALLSDSVRFVTGWVAVPILLYLSMENLLKALVYYVARTKSTSPEKAEERASDFSRGFLVHIINPLTPAFYLAAFSLSVEEQSPQVGLLYGAVPILLDAVIFWGVVRFININNIVQRLPPALVGVPQILSGLLLFFLVAHTSQLETTERYFGAGVPLLSLCATLIAAITVAHGAVQSRKGIPSKILWKALALWDSCFKVLTGVGALITVSSILSSYPDVEAKAKACFVVSGILAAALSYAKATGELQEERLTPNGTQLEIPEGAWQTNAPRVGAFSMLLILALFLLMLLTNFRL